MAATFHAPFNAAPKHQPTLKPNKARRTNEELQLAKDRLIALLVFLLVVAFFGLVFWLAAVNPTATPAGDMYYFMP